jgi:hypothetical protein
MFQAESNPAQRYAFLNLITITQGYVVAWISGRRERYRMTEEAKDMG